SRTHGVRRAARLVTTTSPSATSTSHRSPSRWSTERRAHSSALVGPTLAHRRGASPASTNARHATSSAVATAGTPAKTSPGSRPCSCSPAITAAFTPTTARAGSLPNRVMGAALLASLRCSARSLLHDTRDLVRRALPQQRGVRDELDLRRDADGRGDRVGNLIRHRGARTLAGPTDAQPQ